VVTADCSIVLSTVARTAPLLTFCPTDAATLVTVPLTANDNASFCLGSMVPVVVTVACTVPVVTVVVVVVAVPVDEELPASA
jgi:hypothetical protein